MYIVTFAATRRILCTALVFGFVGLATDDAAAQSFGYLARTHQEQADALADAYELDQAKRLVLLLSRGRLTEDGHVFWEAAKTFNNTFDNELTDKIRQVLEAFEKSPEIWNDSYEVDPVQRERLKRLRSLNKFLGRIHLWTAVTRTLDAMLKYQLATTPTRITAFWAEADGAQKEFNLLPWFQSSKWMLKPEESYRLKFYVSVQFQGSKGLPRNPSGKVITPAGITDQIIKSIVPDPLLPAEILNLGHQMVREYLRPWVKAAVIKALRAASEKLSSKDVLDYGFRYTDAWLNTNELEMVIEERFENFEIGDIVTVQLTPASPAGVIDTTPQMAWHQVRGLARGKEAGFIASFTKPFESLGQHGGQPITRNMWFHVIDDGLPDAKVLKPYVPHVPQWGPSVLPLPKVGELPILTRPEVPKLPEIPQATPPPPLQTPGIPAHLICVQDAMGRWNNPKLCEPK